MDAELKTQSSAATALQPNKYLIGGSGWTRRTSAILTDNKAYVPKGGYVIDFSKREPPSLKQLNYLHKEGKVISKKRETADGQSKSFPVSGNGNGDESQKLDAGKLRSFSNKPSVQDVIDTIIGRAEEGEISRGQGMQSKTVQWVKVPPSTNKNVEESPYVAKPWQEPPNTAVFRKASSKASISTSEHPSVANNRQQWRPPGPTTPTRSISHRSTASRMRSFGAIKKASSKATAVAPHDCSTCKCCSEIREKLESAEGAARQDRAVAGQLRRRLETELARISKEQRDFEAFKVITIGYIISIQ